jgi:hypothetical protein
MSLKNSLDQQDWDKIFHNTLVFVAPTLGIFFGQLALGVEFNKALPVALFALYQSLSDIFNKYKAE